MFTPSKSEFLELARQGNLIPVYREILADTETPVSAYEKLHKRGGSFLLESVEGGERLGRYSFVGSNPRKLIRADARSGPDPLKLLEQELAQFKPVSLPGLPRFTGGAVGFIAYEYVHHIEPTVPLPVRDELKTPTLCFMITDTILVFDRVTQTIKVIANAHVDAKPEVAYTAACARIEEILLQLQQPQSIRPREFRPDAPELKLSCNLTPQQFMDNVTKAQHYIRAGDIIQVVLSQRFETRTRASALDIYRALRSINPSPYMFLVEVADLALVGSSPEIHVRCEDRNVEIRPIAGTRQRGETPEQDAALEKELLADHKERAEHLMLVDLARNDIGRVCEFGSVRVPEFMVVERYSHVMHLVSGVVGRLQSGRTVYDLMRATFPAGTVTGAPKVRAMQIISELEPCQRGPYAGAVGYFSFTGNLDSAITIRTILLQHDRAYVQAGAGIVADSHPQRESEETVNKAKAMLKAIALAETFR